MAALGCAQSLNPLVLGVVLAIVSGVLSVIGALRRRPAEG